MHMIGFLCLWGGICCMEASYCQSSLGEEQLPIIMQIEGPIAHRVYQRNRSEKADIPYTLRMTEPLSGHVEVRLGAAGSNGEGTACRIVGDIRHVDEFEGVITGVPVGRYSLQFRIIDSVSGGLITQAIVEPVFVGDLWILAGQSNMQGCGTLVNVEESQEGVSCLYLDDRWGIAEDPLCWYYEAVDPVHWSLPVEQLKEAAIKERQTRTRGAGLSIPFGKELLRNTGVPVGLIVCAHGGTSMTQWDPDLLDQEGHSLYGSMVRRVRAAGGKVKGCIWYQGENDANSEHGPKYAQRMKRFLLRLREDLREPKLPFIYAQLSIFHSWDKQYESWWDNVQHEQFRLEEELAPCALIATADASLCDPIHLDADSLKEIGKRFAWQALRIAHGTQHVTGPRPCTFQWNADRTELTIGLTGMNGSMQQVDRVFGFQMELAECIWKPVEARLSEERKAIYLRFDETISVDAMLRYGAGYYPALNLRDDWGIPLPLFGPLYVV
ncbi:sialate O-acetylesterase [Paenibacillaceae bacterium]|nr:sialate O-acetylesterase [Paenibacillaceae bacterium]